MTTSSAPQPVYMHLPARGPGCLIQILWFALIGWWLAGLAIGLAWLLNVTVIGLPFGMAILNNIPKLLALQEPRTTGVAVTRPDGGTVVIETTLPQHNLLLRTAFFLLIGWWWSGVWLALAYAVAATVLLLPLALEMFRWTPAMTTLRRY